MFLTILQIQRHRFYFILRLDQKFSGSKDYRTNRDIFKRNVKRYPYTAFVL